MQVAEAELLGQMEELQAKAEARTKHKNTLEIVRNLAEQSRQHLNVSNMQVAEAELLGQMEDLQASAAQDSSKATIWTLSAAMCQQVKIKNFGHRCPNPSDVLQLCRWPRLSCWGRWRSCRPRQRPGPNANDGTGTKPSRSRVCALPRWPWVRSQGDCVM